MAQNKSRVVSMIGLLTMVFFVFFLGAALAEDEKNTKKEPVSKKASSGPSAMKIGKDPDGATRPPTRAEENKLNAELKKTLNKYSKHSPKQKQDGTLTLVVAPHRIHASTAHVGPDGKVHLNCSDAANHLQTKEELPEE
ncbi:MAG: post-PEP-CTERM-1 domain-containing protein [Acidobacteriota bacterium]